MTGFGSRTRVPTLWLYAENDSLFGPELVRGMHEAYVKAGGRVDCRCFRRCSRTATPCSST